MIRASESFTYRIGGDECAATNTNILSALEELVFTHVGSIADGSEGQASTSAQQTPSSHMRRLSHFVGPRLCAKRSLSTAQQCHLSCWALQTLLRKNYHMRKMSCDVESYGDVGFSRCGRSIYLRAELSLHNHDTHSQARSYLLYYFIQFGSN